MSARHSEDLHLLGAGREVRRLLHGTGEGRVSAPTARDPYTITMCWTPDQNFGRVSCLNGRAPVSAVLGLLWAGETRETVAAEYGLTAQEVEVVAALADELLDTDDVEVDER